jgi:hypothetical protein
MTDTKRTMTVWLLISDNDCGTNAVAYSTTRAAYESLLKAIDSYLDDDGAYAPHVELRAVLAAAIAAEDWKAFDAAFEKARDAEVLGIDTLYLERQEMEVPAAVEHCAHGVRLDDKSAPCQECARRVPDCDSCGLSHSAELDCTEVSAEQKQHVLDAARAAQTDFWARLGELETVLGNDVDGTSDLQDESLESLSE